MSDEVMVKLINSAGYITIVKNPNLAITDTIPVAVEENLALELVEREPTLIIVED